MVPRLPQYYGGGEIRKMKTTEVIFTLTLLGIVILIVAISIVDMYINETSLFTLMAHSL